MTDLETLRQMLTRANIRYKEESFANRVELMVELGYLGFYTIFIFDEGTLRDMGAYEA